MAEHVLDATGLKCPLPVLKAKKALRDVPAGEILKILATDPGSHADLQAFCSTTGNEFLDSKVDNGVYTFLIKHTG